MFSICLDEAQAIGPEPRPVGVGRLVTSAEGLAGAAGVATAEDPETGERVDARADFAAELAAELETRARGRSLAGPAAAAPGEAPDPAVRRGTEADPDGHEVSVVPGTGRCLASGAGEGPDEASEVSGTGEARGRGGRATARGKGGAEEDPPVDAGLGLREAGVKATLGVADSGSAEVQRRDSGEGEGQAQVQGAQAAQAAAAMPSASLGAAGRETMPASSAGRSAETRRAEALARRVGGRPASTAAAFPESRRARAVGAASSGTQPVEGPAAGAGEAVSSRDAHVGETHERFSWHARQEAPARAGEQAEEGGVAAVRGARGDELAPGNDVGADHHGSFDESAAERGQAAVEGARSQVAPMGSDGASKAASFGDGQAAHRLGRRENGDTRKLAAGENAGVVDVRAGADLGAGAGAGESPEATANPKQPTAKLGGTSSSLGPGRGQSPEATTGLGIVSSDGAPARLPGSGRRDTSERAASSSRGFPDDLLADAGVEITSGRGSVVGSAQRTASFGSRTRAMRLVPGGSAAEPGARPPRAERTMVSATAEALAGGGVETARDDTSDAGHIARVPRVLRLGEEGVGAAPTGMSVPRQAESGDCDAGAKTQTLGATPPGGQDTTPREAAARDVPIRDEVVPRGAPAGQAVAGAGRADDAACGKTDVGDGRHEEAIRCETPAESRSGAEVEAKARVEEPSRAPHTEPCSPGDARVDGAHHPHAAAGERNALATRKEHEDTAGSDALFRQECPPVQETAVPDVEVSTERPASERLGASGHRAAEDSVGTARRRAAERENSETALDKPSATPVSPNPSASHEAKQISSQVTHGPQAHERETPVTARAVIDQIVQRAQLRLGRSEAEMTIDLKPDVLGKVHLKVTSEQGRVVAEIRAESAATRQLIEAGLGDLKAALAEKGIDLGAVAVSSGFGAGVAWSGGGSRWPGESVGRGPAEAVPRSGRSSALRGATSFTASRAPTASAHLVDCVA